MIMKRSLLFAVLCWIASSVAFAIEQKDGVYQIGNAQDLVAFSNMVASGNGSISGALTADIDMTDVIFTPIGNQETTYSGVFDGQQHYIKNLFIDLSEQEYVGLFGVLSNGAYIKNLIVDKNSEIKGKAFVAGIAGGTNGGGSVTFENCGNEAAVGAQAQNAAGICGVSMSSACGIRMINCFNSGVVAGERECAALCGWVGDSGSVIQNCYNCGYVIGVDGTNTLWRNGNGKGTKNYDSYGNQGELISNDEFDLVFGNVCYQINGNSSTDVVWYQTLGEDDHPVPFATHGIVYAVGDLNCDGTPKSDDFSFSNTNESNRDPHTFEDGICTICDAVDKNYKELTADGFYTLETAKDLNWFAALVNSGVKNVNARLAADIDFTAYTQNDVMIGGDAFSAEESDAARSFTGIFDGAGHTIKVDYAASYDAVALFKVVEDATIKNLKVEGSIETTQRFAGGLMFVTRGTSLFENIVVAVDIFATYPGDATHGGICAVAHEHPTFSNCAFVGTMDAADCEGSAGIIGYAHGEVETVIKNSYVAAEVMNLANGSTVIARHVKNKLNCYYTDNIVSVVDNDVNIISEDALSTGELCCQLNAADAIDAWRQNLGADTYPVPFADHKMVYASGALNCDGTPKGDIVYTNDESGMQRDEHNYVDDICSVCGARIIRNAAQLEALANDINDGVIVDGKVIVDVVEDIDMKDVDDFQGIGIRFSEDTGEVDNDQNPIINDVKRPFTGTFDGHGHKISNMFIDAQSGNKGLFSLVSAATIKNIIVDESCEIYSTGYSAGIVGTVIGSGVLTIENCGNEALINVGVEGANGAGILGVNDLSQAYVRIINCYNTGDIVGQRECGAISGWLGDVGEVINCWNSGSVAPEAVDGDRTFARYSGSTMKFENNYELGGSQVEQIEEDDLASGKLCFLLNKNAETPVFYQTLGADAHPVFDATHGVVYQTEDGGYSNDASASAIEATPAVKNSKVQAVYSISGARQLQLQRGINIVRMADGSVKKIMKY